MSTISLAHSLTLSETGLKLIKAYEGFRPVDRVLINGQRVVGYGHRLYNEDPMKVSKADAEKMLREDLKAYEDMVNDNTHAPLTQGQFDALVSFAYNIGPKAFLESDTLRAINNGRPLDAANALDIWRKSTINGKTYVVDALMRRRTAEKALFLKTDNRPRPASGVDLPPLKDEALRVPSTDDGLPIFEDEKNAGFVTNVPVETPQPARRQGEDSPVGSLEFSEYRETTADSLQVSSKDDPNTDNIRREESQDELILKNVVTPSKAALAPEETLIEETPLVLTEVLNPQSELTEERSIIAEAAADISERLDALIENVQSDGANNSGDWSQSFREKDTPSLDIDDDTLVVFPRKTKRTETQKPNLKLVANDINETKNLAASSKADASLFKDIEPAPEDLGKSTAKKADIIIDNLSEDDALRAGDRSMERYLDVEFPQNETETESHMGYWMIILLGFIIIGIATALSFRGAETLLGQWGPLAVLSGFLIGGLMVLGALYYAARHFLRS